MRPRPPIQPETTRDEPLIALYRETLPALHVFVARRAGGSRELVEDVLQEVYLRAVEAWSADRPPHEPVPWLRTLARNLLVTHYRKHRPRLVGTATLDALVDGSAPDDSPDAVALVQLGLARLPERHARPVEAFHLDGRSVREIATELRLSERAVEGRLTRGRRALRKQLEPLLEREGDDR